MVTGSGRIGGSTPRAASVLSCVVALVASAFGCGGSSTSHDDSRNRAGAGDDGGTSSGVGGSPAQGGTTAVGGTASDQGGVGATGSVGTTGGLNPTGGTSAGTGGTPPEPPIEECVLEAVQIPWVLEGEFVSTRDIDLELVSLPDEVVVVRRRVGYPTWIRSYGRDGVEIGEAQLEERARFVATADGKLVVVTSEDGSIYGRTWTPSLSFVEDEFSIPIVTESELLLSALRAGNEYIVLTDQRFVNATAGIATSWAQVLASGGGTSPTADDRIYGTGASNGELLVSWGGSSSLVELVLTTAGGLTGYASDDDYFPYPGSENATAVQVGAELVMLHGNPVGTTRLGFDLSHSSIGTNRDYVPFYRIAPPLSLTAWGNRPLGVWLAVPPGGDFHQDFTGHDLWGCLLDLEDATACAESVRIAELGLTGYELDYQPLAAAVLGDELVVTHNDEGSRVWLRFVDLECAFGAGG